MGFDLGHTISSLAKLALRTKQNIDKQSNEGKKIKLYQLWTDRTYRAFETKEKTGYKAFMFRKVSNCIQVAITQKQARKLEMYILLM